MEKRQEEVKIHENVDLFMYVNTNHLIEMTATPHANRFVCIVFTYKLMRVFMAA